MQEYGPVLFKTSVAVCLQELTLNAGHAAGDAIELRVCLSQQR